MNYFKECKDMKKINKELLYVYNEIESRFPITDLTMGKASYVSQLNFSSGKNYPIHRWFYFKEGFSPELVRNILNEANLKSSCKILDPFCGCGTTLLTAKQEGYKSIGFEVNPFSAFAARIKTRDYSKDEITRFRETSKLILQSHGKPSIDPPSWEMSNRVFAEDVLTQLLWIKEKIQQVENGKIRDLLFFGWLATLESVSLYRKAGNGLKARNKLRPHCPSMFSLVDLELRNKFKLMEVDLFSSASKACAPEPVIHQTTVLNATEHINKEAVHLIIFSPPYANCFDYCKIYGVELWFGDFVTSNTDLKEIRESSLISHVHHSWNRETNPVPLLPELYEIALPLIEKQHLWDKKIPKMLKGYFEDMNEVLKRMYYLLKPGGLCVIVVSNSAYNSVVIPTDLFLAKMAWFNGFQIKEILIDRLIVGSSQQWVRTKDLRKYMRESVIKLQKPEAHP